MCTVTDQTHKTQPTNALLLFYFRSHKLQSLKTSPTCFVPFLGSSSGTSCQSTITQIKLKIKVHVKNIKCVKDIQILGVLSSFVARLCTADWLFICE
jgi:hypothetical protein